MGYTVRKVRFIAFEADNIWSCNQTNAGYSSFKEAERRSFGVEIIYEETEVWETFA